MSLYWTALLMVCVHNYLTGSYIHTFLSCLRCCVFLNGSLKKTCRHCVSVGGTHREATGQQSGTCLHFRSTLWSSTVSTFLKLWSCHLTPPHDFLCSLPVCLCWWTTPLAILSSIVPHFLWTSKGMQGWPFENYGRFQKSLQEMTI